MEKETVQKCDLVDGIYLGKWTGYHIKLLNGYDLFTDTGVKGFDIPVKVEVKNKEFNIISF